MRNMRNKILITSFIWLIGLIVGIYIKEPFFDSLIYLGLSALSGWIIGKIISRYFNDNYIIGITLLVIIVILTMFLVLYV